MNPTPWAMPRCRMRRRTARLDLRRTAIRERVARRARPADSLETERAQLEAALAARLIHSASAVCSARVVSARSRVSVRAVGEVPAWAGASVRVVFQALAPVGAWRLGVGPGSRATAAPAVVAAGAGAVDK